MASTMTNLELDYIHTVLLVDEKNYHAWSHRQWIVSKMMDAARTTTIVSTTLSNTTLATSIYDQELMYCENFIHRDIRNNSAWNHRWFIVHVRTDNRGSTPGGTAMIVPLTTTMEQEMDFAIDIIAIDPYNESPCKYLVALVRELCDIYNTDDCDIDRRNNNDNTINNNTEPGSGNNIPTSIAKQHGDMIQNVMDQLHNIEQNHLLASDHATTTDGGMETTTSGSERTTAASRIPSMHLCRALSEIDGSRPIWMVDDHSKK